MAGFLAALAALLPVRVASAGDPLSAGATLVGLGGAFSVSHQVEGLDTINGLQLLPHVGYVISDRFGTGALRGALEVVLEPTLMHLDSGVGTSTVVGLSALARWIFAGRGRLRPYVEAGAGMLVGETALAWFCGRAW